MGESKAKKAYKSYTPQNGDNLKKIAERETTAGNEITANDISKFNWGTTDKDEVNQFLRDKLGCHLVDASKNYVITDDCKDGVLKIPMAFALKNKLVDSVVTIKVKKKKKPPQQFKACAKIKGVTFDAHKSFIKPSVADDLKKVERALEAHPDAKIMIWGHVDKNEENKKEKNYQKKLSERRARSAYAFITNDADYWETLFNKEEWGVGPLAVILKDLGYSLTDPNIRTAIEKFQKAKGIWDNGVPKKETRLALFKDYMAGKHDIDLEASDFMNPRYMGCSYFNTEVKKDKINRRSMFYFFNKDRLPVLPCAMNDLDPCKKQTKAPANRNCKTYTCAFYDSIAKGCDKVTAEQLEKAIWVYLKLEFKDPEDKKKTYAFPKDLSVKVLYKDGTTETKQITDGGLLNFKAEKEKESFTLQFEFSDKTYVVVPPKGKEGKTKTAKDSEVKDLIKNKNRFFMLPNKWTVEQSDWEVDSFKSSYEKGRFISLDTATSDIGVEGAPVKMTLDPHWHFVRFEYFDQKYGPADHKYKLVAIPPVLVQGKRKVKLSKVKKEKYDTPDAASCWGVNLSDQFKAAQAIPWIVTKDKNKKDLPGLDKQMVLEFGEKDQWIVSKSAKEREIEILKKADNKDKLKPGIDRSKYYDLPILWKSVNYYTWLPDGKGKFFTKLTSKEVQKASDPTKPLRFCLDDIVLISKNGRQKISDRTRSNNKTKLSKHSRVSILSTGFEGSGDPYGFFVGIYDNDPFSSYHTAKPFRRNYLYEYGRTTRALFFCSNCYHVFDKRTQAKSGLLSRMGMFLEQGLLCAMTKT